MERKRSTAGESGPREGDSRAEWEKRKERYERKEKAKVDEARRLKVIVSDRRVWRGSFTESFLWGEKSDTPVCACSTTRTKIGSACSSRWGQLRYLPRLPPPRDRRLLLPPPPPRPFLFSFHQLQRTTINIINGDLLRPHHCRILLRRDLIPIRLLLLLLLPRLPRRPPRQILHCCDEQEEQEEQKKATATGTGSERPCSHSRMVHRRRQIIGKSFEKTTTTTTTFESNEALEEDAVERRNRFCCWRGCPSSWRPGWRRIRRLHPPFPPRPRLRGMGTTTCYRPRHDHDGGPVSRATRPRLRGTTTSNLSLLLIISSLRHEHPRPLLP